MVNSKEKSKQQTLVEGSSFSKDLKSLRDRPIDWIMFLYFTSHIPIAIFIDLIGIYPEWSIPNFVSKFNEIYVGLSGDPFMNRANTMYWFKSFSYCEAFLQLPFFFFAVYGLLKNKKWIQLPTVVYCAHTMTTVVPLIFELILSKSKYELSNIQLAILLSLYPIYFFLPALGLVDNYRKITYRIIEIDQAQKTR